MTLWEKREAEKVVRLKDISNNLVHHQSNCFAGSKSCSEGNSWNRYMIVSLEGLLSCIGFPLNSPQSYPWVFNETTGLVTVPAFPMFLSWSWISDTVASNTSVGDVRIFGRWYVPGYAPCQVTRKTRCNQNTLFGKNRKFGLRKARVRKRVKR